MASCGISLNLSSLESKITANITAMLGVAGMAGLPYATSGLLVGVALANGNFLAAINIIVPSDALDGLWSGLRDEFDGIMGASDVPDLWDDGFIGPIQDFTPGGDSWTDKLGETVSGWGDGLAKFGETTGLDQLSGYVDINVTDLAKSAIGIGGSFDSCDFGTSGIQNYFKDPATGTIKLLANYSPKLGDTGVAKSNSVWGLTASVNQIFQTGKGSIQTQLNVALGDVVSSGTNYALDSITGSTNIDSRDISNMKQWISDYVSPTYYQTMRTAPDGSRYLASETTNINDVKSKISGVFSASESNLNVMLAF